MKILLVRLGSLGDLVHALPVASALRGRYPDARIDWLVDARYAAILDLVPTIDGRVVIAPGRRLRVDRPGHPGDVRFDGWAGLLGAVRHLRRQRYDAAIDLQGLIKSAVLARASGARRVVGFDAAALRERQARFFYSETVGAARDARHVVFKNLSVLPSLDTAIPTTLSFPLDVPVSPALVALRQRLDAAGTREFALVNAGAAWPNKRWPAERFGAVAAALRQSQGLVSVVSWGPGEERLAEQVVAASAGAALAAPPTAVGDLLAMAAEARLMISGDTGPLHLAAALGTPLVAVFGPTDPGRNGPWAAEDISLSRFGDCVCHYVRRCRRQRLCIEDITVEDVLAAIERRLAQLSRPRA